MEGRLFVLWTVWTVRAEFFYMISHIIDQETIRGLEVCRAPGQCSTTNRVLKHLPKLAINFLTKMFNAVLRRQYLPAAGKYDHVIFVRSQGRIPGCLCPVVPLASCRENILFSSILSEICGAGCCLASSLGSDTEAAWHCTWLLSLENSTENLMRRD
jgi:hypothetical protein